jgi:HK97 family phage portal protein
MFNWFKKKAVEPTPQKKSYGYLNIGDVSPGTLGDYMFGNYDRLLPSQTAGLYRKASAVGIAVDTIADEVEKINPVLKSDGEILDTHPVLDLLKQPNMDETKEQFIGQLARDWLLNHDAIAVTMGNNDRPPLEIYGISPQRVSASTTTADIVRNYLVTNGIARGSYAREEVKRSVRYVDGPLKALYHIKGYTSRPYSPWGDSPLETALLEARSQIEGRYHNLKLLQNGARLSLVAVFKHMLDEDELRERRLALNEQLGGSSNAGKIATVSTDEMELHEVGTNNKDMDYANLDNISYLTIMQRYKIPLPLVSDKAQTFDNFSEAVFQLYDRAVLPCYGYIMSNLSRVLLPRYGLDPTRVQISFDPESIPALVARMLDQLLKRKELAVETTNELRELLPNREPLEGGDTLYIPATLVPMGETMDSEESLNRTDDQVRQQQDDTGGEVEEDEDD